MLKKKTLTGDYQDFLLAFFATALLLSMPMPNRVIALMPYWLALGSLQSSTVTSLRKSVPPLRTKLSRKSLLTK
jgi:hypothetical protein